MVNKYVFTVLIGVLIWLVSNSYFYPFITNLVLEKGYPVYLFTIYSITFHLLIGFWVGWVGKSKGWLLGVILGGSCALLFVAVTLVSDFQSIEFRNAGYFRVAIKLVLYHSFFTAVIVIAALSGWKVREKLAYYAKSSRRNA